MQDKIIHFLLKFSYKERKYFEDFLRSPVFNKREKLLLLYQHILDNCLRDDGKALDEEAVFAEIYPAEGFVVNKVRKLKAALLECLLEFLRFREWKNEPSYRGDVLLKALHAMGEEHFFMPYYQKAKTMLEKEEQNLDWFDQAFELEKEMVLFQHSGPGRGDESKAGEMLEAMENAVMLRVLKFAYTGKTLEKVLGKTFLPLSFDRMISAFDRVKVDHNILLRIYDLLLKTSSEEGLMSEMQELKSLVLNHAENVDTEEAREILNGTINNLNWRGKSLGKPFYAELFVLNRKIYELLVKERGLPLSIAEFKNASLIGCRVADYEWVEMFISESANYLEGNSETKEGAKLFNLGVCRLYQKRYLEAEALFNKSLNLIRAPFYSLAARAYLLMIYVETGDSVGMESLVHSFRMYLDRSSALPAHHKDAYHEFIRLTRRMIGLPPGDLSKKEKLEKEIARLNFRAGQEWLLEKISGQNM